MDNTMNRAVLKTKDGKIFYGDPYESNCDYNAPKYQFKNKSYFMQDLDELMKAISKNGLGLLDVIDFKIECV